MPREGASKHFGLFSTLAGMLILRNCERKYEKLGCFSREEPAVNKQHSPMLFLSDFERGRIVILGFLKLGTSFLVSKVWIM